DLIKLVGLVDQMDNHIPTLTVRETFKFADMCVNGRPEDQPEETRDVAALRTELFTQILGLEECADTVVGDALLRGVSGGERKRVTIGEVLVGGQSLFLCDEISTGLDSAATFDIIKSMRYIVYHGPRTEILNYFEGHGFTCPPRVDPADFLIEVTSDRGHRYANGSIPIKDLAVASEDFNNLFCQSSIYRKTHEAISKGFNEHQFESAEDFKKAKSVANLARSKEKSEFGLAFVPSTMLLLNRQKLIWLRDPPLLWGKLIEALIIGLVMGMIYFNSKTLLESFSIKQGTGYIWFGVIVLVAYYFVFTMLNGLALHFIRYEKYKGVTPKAMTDNAPEEDNVYVQVKTPGAADQASKGGYTAYFGDLGVDSVKMLEYFASIPGTEEIRPQYNPATYMLEVIGAGIGRDVKDYSVEYKNSELCRKNRERTLELCEVSNEFVRHSTLNYRSIATGFWNQLGQLSKKQQLTYWRNPQYNFMRMFLFPIFAVIFGTTFYQLSAASVKKINSHIGLIYNSMDFIGVVNLMTVLEVTCAERAVFYRERMSNYYGPLPYSLSLWFAEIPYLVVVIILFVTIEYWLVGWSDNAGDFFFFLFVFYLYTSACTYVGQWMSVLMPNEKVANVAVGALSCLFNLFSGYLLPRTAMRRGYKWFTYLMPSSYSLAALVGVQFGDNQDIIAVTSGSTTTNMTVAHYIEITYDFRPNRKYNFMVGLIVIWVVVQLAIYLTLKYVSHLKR
ncbi:hypothetical protein PF010_g3434, partial [Phytophthora fragariae]